MAVKSICVTFSTFLFLWQPLFCTTTDSLYFFILELVCVFALNITFLYGPINHIYFLVENNNILYSSLNFEGIQMFTKVKMLQEAKMGYGHLSLLSVIDS